MLSGAGSSPQVAKAKMVLGKNPGEAMAIAEQILNTDPNNSSAHRIIVDAANALELPHTAVLSYETLVRHSPKDRNLAIDFAHAPAAAVATSAKAKTIAVKNPHGPAARQSARRRFGARR